MKIKYICIKFVVHGIVNEVKHLILGIKLSGKKWSLEFVIFIINICPMYAFYIFCLLCNSASRQILLFLVGACIHKVKLDTFSKVNKFTRPSTFLHGFAINSLKI